MKSKYILYIAFSLGVSLLNCTTALTGTYTYDTRTGNSTYTSSLNPGVIYTYP